MRPLKNLTKLFKAPCVQILPEVINLSGNQIKVTVSRCKVCANDDVGQLGEDILKAD